MADGPLRRARPDDGPEIAEVWLRSRRAAEIPASVHSDDDVRRWVSDILLARCDVWVALAAGRPVGLMALLGEELGQLYVAPEHQRHGHGTRLLQLAQTRQDSLTLWTFVSNVLAQRFYEAHGFIRSGPVSAENEEQAPAIRYRWQRTP